MPQLICADEWCLMMNVTSGEVVNERGVILNATSDSDANDKMWEMCVIYCITSTSTPSIIETRLLSVHNVPTI